MTTIAKKVLKFIEKESLLEKSENSLVAVSGGMDSMSLLHLLFTHDYKISVAHVNYKLRGVESDHDQELVQNYCRNNGIVCHILELDKFSIDDLKSGNLQEKARDIRYDFFKNLCKEHNYSSICTAHHRDDRIETMFINLTRGSSLSGLTSLQPSHGQIRRPLITIWRSEIKQYAQEFQIPYRDDHTNESLNYDRNFFRNKILKDLFERIPRSQAALQLSIEHLSEDRAFRDQQIISELLKYRSEQHGIIRIGPLSTLRTVSFGEYLLFHGIKALGMNRTQAKNILSNSSTESKDYYSSTHKAIVKDDWLIIKSQENEQNKIISIDAFGSHQLTNGILTISETELADYNNDPNIEYASVSLTKGELMVRTWRHGDQFKPFGMNGLTKKISDYFNDLRLNKFEKEKVNLLVQNEQIVWVIGYRLGHDFRVKKGSEIIKLSYTPSST